MLPSLTGAQDTLPSPLSHRRASNNHGIIWTACFNHTSHSSASPIDSTHVYSLWGTPVSPFTTTWVRTLASGVPSLLITLNTDHRILAFSIPCLCPDSIVLRTHMPWTRSEITCHSESFRFSSIVFYQNANSSEYLFPLIPLSDQLLGRAATLSVWGKFV